MTTDDLTKRIAKAVERVTCLRWEDTDDCGYCESNMVTCRHSSYMYCDAHDTITKPGDRCPHAAEVAAAVLPIVGAEVRDAKAEALRDAARYFASGLHCADMRSTPEETVRYLNRRATEYETGDQA